MKYRGRERSSNVEDRRGQKNINKLMGWSKDGMLAPGDGWLMPNGTMVGGDYRHNKMVTPLSREPGPLTIAEIIGLTSPKIRHGRTSSVFGQGQGSAMGGVSKMPTDEELRLAVYTVLGEAAHEGEEGMKGIANVIRNRSESGRYPDSIGAVVMQSNSRGVHQFSPWNAGSGNYPPSKWSTGSAKYKQAERIMLDVLKGTVGDNTFGATHFHNPAISSPGWANAEAPKGFIDIGNHRFGKRTDEPRYAVAEVAPIPAVRQFNQLPDSLMAHSPGKKSLTVQSVTSVPIDPLTGTPATRAIEAATDPIQRETVRLQYIWNASKKNFIAEQQLYQRYAARTAELYRQPKVPEKGAPVPIQPESGNLAVEGGLSGTVQMPRSYTPNIVYPRAAPNFVRPEFPHPNVVTHFADPDLPPGFDPMRVDGKPVDYPQNRPGHPRRRPFGNDPRLYPTREIVPDPNAGRRWDPNKREWIDDPNFRVTPGHPRRRKGIALLPVIENELGPDVEEEIFTPVLPSGDPIIDPVTSEPVQLPRETEQIIVDQIAAPIELPVLYHGRNGYLYEAQADGYKRIGQFDDSNDMSTEALIARESGARAYTTTSGALMPLYTTSGKPRKTYGDEQFATSKGSLT